MLTQNLGYPRIGARRELKKACESYWAGKISKQELLDAGKLERQKNWQVQKDANIDLIPCNDFSFYDHVQDMNFTLGVIPPRFVPLKEKLSDIDLYFSMCRGYQDGNNDVIAMEMTKWFDTNYHYIVPEFNKNQSFSFYDKKIIRDFLEAKEFGIKDPKPVLLGPISYLLLGKEKDKGFHRLELTFEILPVYLEIIKELISLGCKHIQFDEPYLVGDIEDYTKSCFYEVYQEIKKQFPELSIILATYFDSLGANISFTTSLPIDVLHVDLTKGTDDFDELLDSCPKNLKLSLGIIDGRNIWKNNYKHSLDIIDKVIKKQGKDQVILAPSCSFLHCPYDLEMETNETNLPKEVKQWMAFSKQKLNELNVLKKLKTMKDTQYDDNFTELINNSKLHSERSVSTLTSNSNVKNKVESIKNNEINRDSAFNIRIQKQNKRFNFKPFTTTTIGSFPQTKEVRKKRKSYRQGLISKEEYELFIKKEIEKAINLQEKIGLDVLVHGEFERNDMVEYFGELLEGFAFTENGWVQSYGSRGVKPPIIYGDVYRKEAMTVNWSVFAQSLTSKRVKGMLTGPVTILQWSFVRDDQPNELTTFQIANALREEVLDLEKSGIDIIQIDEPALREGLPLKIEKWNEYLGWAVKAFRVCSWGVKDETQIHTHMCYSEFNDIMIAIAAMDADVISIETSRSQMELLDVFNEFKYPNQIGPGVYDIHSSRIPTVSEIENLLTEADKYISRQNLWVNPDCGLKTRLWKEVIPALENMVSAAAIQRKKAENAVY